MVFEKRMSKRKSKSMVVKRKTKVEETLKPSSFLESMTTLHGTNYFVLKKGRSLALWAILMLVNMGGTVSFLLAIRERYNADQIVTKIYADWPVDKVPFPAVTICNLNTVSLNETKTIENILRKNKIEQREIDSFFRDLYYLLDFAEGSAEVQNHVKIMDILKSHYYNMDIVMAEVHQKCENLLLYCEFNRKPKKCKDIFSKIQSIGGYCCSFNFDGLDDDYVDPSLSHDDDFEYYYDQGADYEDVRTSMVATSQSGSSSGLRVVFNVEPKEYGSWALPFAYGAKIIISDPNDFVETRLTYSYMIPGESMYAKVEPVIYQSEDNLRLVDVQKRGCWFHKEVDLLHTNRYSYETCSTECKIRNFIQFCGCVPYKYPVEKGTRICEFSDLPCLHYMKGEWDSVKIPCVPECYKECQDKSYTVVTDTVPFLSEYYPASVSTGRNVSELASLHVYYMRSTCKCYMMTLLSDTNTFIATYGGIFSLCFGVSLITLFELAYLSMALLAKFVWNLTGKNKINILY